MDDDYSVTMIGRSKRDYLWIMARTPTLPETTLARLFGQAEALGYDPGSIRMVPQRW